MRFAELVQDIQQALFMKNFVGFTLDGIIEKIERIIHGQNRIE
jgi:hypothetical protein